MYVVDSLFDKNMADRHCSHSLQAEGKGNGKGIGKGFERENNRTQSMSSPRHKSTQTDQTLVRDIGVQFDPPSPKDVDTAVSQNGIIGADTQMTSAPTVNVARSSGTQIGSGNRIFHNNNSNNTSNVTNHYTYNIICQQCHPVQHDDLIRWVQEQVKKSTEHTTTQISESNQTKQHPRYADAVWMSDTSSNRLEPSDADSVCISDTFNTRLEPSDADTVWMSDISSNRLEASDEDTIVDNSGQRLEPGDAVWTGFLFGKWAVYVGCQQIVSCAWNTGGSVLKEKLDLAQPFGEGRCRVFSPEEVVARAESRVGTEFTEGSGLDDFPAWVMTGMGYFQAADKGFQLLS